MNTGAQLGTAIGVAVLVLVASASYGPLAPTAVGWAVAAGGAAAAAGWLVLRVPHTSAAGRERVARRP